MRTTQETKATANYSKRTFTIRKNGTKYRTTPMSRDEFESCLWNTSNDWNQYLSACNDYYVVK